MQSKRRTVGLTSLAMVGALALAAVGSAQVASNTQKEEFTAFAINTSNVGRTGATTVDITVERYSTDAERDRLMTVFKEKGPEALLDALRDMPRVGTIRTPDSLAYDLHYARELKAEDGGRRIILATDRPIGMWEAVARPRTIDYPFTVIELHMKPEGNDGVGKLSVATKLTLNDNVLVLENFANQPVMLTNVRSRTKSK